MNGVGIYGSSVGVNSVRNSVGIYGSTVSTYSANNNVAAYPPIIYKHGVALYYLTTNAIKTPGVSLAQIDAACSFLSSSPITWPANGPTAISAADGADTDVLAVSWSSVAGATSYNVYVSTTNSNYSLAGNTSNLSANITGLDQGVTYYVLVTAVNSGGESQSNYYDTGYLAESIPSSFTVTPSAGSNGSIIPADPQTVSNGSTISFTVTPDSGYEISGVEGSCGGSLSGSTYTTNAINSDCTVTASFSEIPRYTVTPSVYQGAGGEISPTDPQSVQSGETLTFTLTPDSNYRVYGVTGTCGGDYYPSTSSFVTDPVTADCTVEARFYVSTDTYTVSITGGENGTVNPSGDQNVYINGTLEVVLTPDSGYEIDNVGGTCGGSLSGTTYTTNAITADCSVNVTFREIPAQSCDTFGTSGAYVQKIFIAYLGRPAAPAGLEYFANYLDNDNEGGKLILFDDLYYSAEATDLYTTYSLPEQINQFYQFMFSRDALSGGLNYWTEQINGGYFTVPASAAYIADAASGPDMAVLDAKQVAASKLTCAIGSDADKLSAFQANLAAARTSLAGVTTAEQAEAYDGDAELASIIGSPKLEPGAKSRAALTSKQRNGGVEAIPTFPPMSLFIFSFLMTLLSLTRLRASKL